MNVSDVMVKSVSVCKPDDDLGKATEAMWVHRCGVLPVVNDVGLVTSMITDRDICIALGTRNARAGEVFVRDVAPARVFTCKATDDVQTAVRTMIAQNVRRLPVTDEDGRIAGILSIDDLVLHSTDSLRGVGISQSDLIRATKTILEDRNPAHAHTPAELVAAGDIPAGNSL